MSTRVLVAFGTKHGSTREVAQHVAETLREEGLDVDLLEAGLVDDVSAYDGVVVGGAIYTGRWHPAARRVLQRNSEALRGLPVAVFGMGPRTMGPDEVAESRQQLDRALAAVRGVEPFAVAVFGGAITPAKLHFPFNRMPASDARDWAQIREWAEGLVPVLACGKAAPDARDARRELQQSPR